MSKVRRFKQIGSAVAFTIVGVVLTAALIVSVYFIRQHGEQARKEQAIAAYDKQKTEQAAEEANDNDESENEQSSSSSSESTGTETSAPSTQELPLTGPASIIGDLLAVGTLTVAVTGYVSSRRNRVRSL